jgi:transcriptional regulator with XRE-family HTH domain
MDIESFFPDQNRHVRFLLGLYITRKRKEAGITIAEVATKADVSPQSIKRIEAGRMKISFGLFKKIQPLINLEPDDLNEIRRIAGVAFINDLSKFLVPDFPA